MTRMRSLLASRLVAALLVPALLASGAAQALAARCDGAVMSCCAKKSEAAARTVTGEAHRCCPVAAAPAGNEEARKTAVPPAPLPVLVAVIGPAVRVAPPAVQDRPDAPALDPPPGPDLVLSHCSLLI
jgi:hypothetical protein